MDVKLKVDNACGTPKKITHTDAGTTTVHGAAAAAMRSTTTTHIHSIDQTTKRHRQQSTSAREVGSTKPGAATDRNRKGGKENGFSNKRKNVEQQQQQRALIVVNPSEPAEKSPVDAGSHTSEEQQQPTPQSSEQPTKCHHKWCNSFSIPNTRDPRIISSAYQRQGVHSRCHKCSRYLPYEVKPAHKNKPPPPPSVSISPASSGVANSIKHPPPASPSKVKAATPKSSTPTANTRYTLAAPHRIKKKKEASKLQAIPSILSSTKHLQQSVKASKEVAATTGGADTSVQERKEPAANARVKLTHAAVELQQTFQNNSDLVQIKQQKTSMDGKRPSPLTRNGRSVSLAESLVTCSTPPNIGHEEKSSPTVVKPAAAAVSPVVASPKHIRTDHGRTKHRASSNGGAEYHKTKDPSVDTAANKLTTGLRCRAAVRSKSEHTTRRHSTRELHEEGGSKSASPKQVGHVDDRLKPKQATAQEKLPPMKTKPQKSPRSNCDVIVAPSSGNHRAAGNFSPVCEPESAVEFYNFINPERANILRKYMKPCYDENGMWSDDSSSISSEKNSATTVDPKVIVEGEVINESASEKRKLLNENGLKKVKPAEFARSTPNLVLKSRHPSGSKPNIGSNSPCNNGKRLSTEGCSSPNSMRNGCSKKPTVPQKVFLADDGMFQQALLSVSPKPQAPIAGGASVPRKECNEKRTVPDRMVPKNNEVRKQIDPVKTRKPSSESSQGSNKSPRSSAVPLKAAAQSSKANNEEGKKLKTTADEKGKVVGRKDEVVTTTTTTKVAICNDDGTISVRNFVAGRHSCTDSDGSNSPHRSILVQRSNSCKPTKDQRKKVAFPPAAATDHKQVDFSVFSSDSPRSDDGGGAVRVGAPKRARITEPPHVWKKKSNEQQRKSSAESSDSLVEERGGGGVARLKKFSRDPCKPSPVIEAVEKRESNKTKRGRPKKGRMTEPGKKKTSKSVEVSWEGETTLSPKIATSKENKPKKGVPFKARMTEPEKKKGIKPVGDSCANKRAPCLKSAIHEENAPKRGVPKTVRMTEPEKKKLSKTVEVPPENETTPSSKITAAKENKPKKGVPKKVRMTEPKKKKLNKTVEVPSENETTPSLKISIPEEKAPKKDVPKKVRIIEPDKKKLCKTVEDSCEHETTLSLKITVSKENKPKKGVPKKVRMTEPEKKKLNKTVEVPCESEIKSSLISATTPQQNDPQQIPAREKSVEIEPPSELLRGGGRKKGAPSKTRITEPAKNFLPPVVSSLENWKTSIQNHNCKVEAASKLKASLDIPQFTRKKSKDQQPSLPPPVTAISPLYSIKQCGGSAQPNRDFAMFPASAPISPEKEKLFKDKLAAKVREVRVGPGGESTTAELLATCERLSVDDAAAHVRSKKRSASGSPRWRSTEISNCKLAKTNNGAAAAVDTQVDSSTTDSSSVEKNSNLTQLRMWLNNSADKNNNGVRNSCDKQSQAAAATHSKSTTLSHAGGKGLVEQKKSSLVTAEFLPPSTAVIQPSKTVENLVGRHKPAALQKEQQRSVADAPKKCEQRGLQTGMKKKDDSLCEITDHSFVLPTLLRRVRRDRTVKRSMFDSSFSNPKQSPSTSPKHSIAVKESTSTANSLNNVDHAPSLSPSTSLTESVEQDDAVTNSTVVEPVIDVVETVASPVFGSPARPCSTLQAKEVLPCTKPTQNVSISKPSSQNVSATKPSSQNVSVSKPWTQNVSATKPSSQNVSVSKPSTQNVSLSKPWTQNVSVSKPSTQNVSVSKTSTQNVSVSKPSTQSVSATKPSTQNVFLSKPSTRNVSASPLKLPPPITSTSTASVTRSQQKSTASAASTRPNRMSSRKAAILSRVEASLKELQSSKQPQDEETTVNSNASVEQIVKAAESNNAEVVTLPFSSPVVDDNGGKTFVSMAQPHTFSAMTSIVATEVTKESPPYECRNENGKRKAPVTAPQQQQQQLERFDRNNDHHMPFKKRRFSREFPTAAPTRTLASPQVVGQVAAMSRASDVMDSLAHQPSLMKTLPSVASASLSSVPKLPLTPPSKKAARIGRPTPKSRMTLPAGRIRPRPPVVKDSSKKVVSPLKLSLKMKAATATKGKSCTRKPLTASSTFGCNETRVNTDFNSLFGGVVQSGTFFTQTNNYEWSSTNPPIELIFSMSDDDEDDQNTQVFAQKHHMIDMSKIGFGKLSCVPMCVLKNDPHHQCCDCCDSQCCTSPWVNMDLL